MTFILALGNPDQVIQVSDRRLTADGQLQEREENKASLVTLADARLLCGFTGIAKWGSFRAGQWLLDAVLETAAPDFALGGVSERLKEAATRRFDEPPLANLAASERRFTIILSGYLYGHEPPLMVYGLISNYQDFDSGVDHAEAWREFQIWRFTERRPTPEPIPTFVQRVGVWQAMSDSDVVVLRTLLSERRPSRAMVGKAVEVVRDIAARRSAQGLVGTELTSAVLFPDPAHTPEAGFHVTKASHQVVGFNQVVATGPDHQFAMMDPVIEAMDPSSAPPIVVPKIGRNQPCPCGSGKKYKRCHGAN
jgi:hypothetical protein